jgi:hypothetical protein
MSDRVGAFFALRDDPDLVARAEALGYESVWAAEGQGSTGRAGAGRSRQRSGRTYPRDVRPRRLTSGGERNRRQRSVVTVDKNEWSATPGRFPSAKR